MAEISGSVLLRHGAAQDRRGACAPATPTATGVSWSTDATPTNTLPASADAAGARPLRLLEIGNQLHLSIKVVGGGVSGQAGAVRHGHRARAGARWTRRASPPMRKAGFLTRDPRMKERKKYGLKRARKAPQYTKR